MRLPASYRGMDLMRGSLGEDIEVEVQLDVARCEVCGIPVAPTIEGFLHVARCPNIIEGTAVEVIPEERRLG